MLDADDHDVFAWRLDALERIARRDAPSLTTAASCAQWCSRSNGSRGRTPPSPASVTPGAARTCWCKPSCSWR